MNRDDFIHASSSIRLREKELLSEETYRRMIEADDFHSAVRVLDETKYGPALARLSQEEEYEKALSEVLENTYKNILSIIPDPSVVELLSLRYDAHNLKVMLKDHFLGTNSEYLFINIGRIFSAGEDRSLRDLYERVLTEHYTTFSENKDPQFIELVVDKLYFSELSRLAGEVEGEAFKNYVLDYIDFTNLISLFRMKKQHRNPEEIRDYFIDGGKIEVEDLVNSYYLEVPNIVDKFKTQDISSYLQRGLKAYEESGRLSEFEKYMDDYQMDKNRDFKYITYGPEVIFSYLKRLETEIKNIRIILVSKQNQADPRSIEERVRDVSA